MGAGGCGRAAGEAVEAAVGVREVGLGERCTRGLGLVYSCFSSA